MQPPSTVPYVVVFLAHIVPILRTYHRTLQLSAGSTDARGDDLHGLIAGMANFLNKAGAVPPLDPTSRSDRGRSHPNCGDLLCPIQWDWNNMT